MKTLRVVVIVVYTFLGVLPLAWLALSAIKHHPDTITSSAKFVPLPGAEGGGPGLAFSPTFDGFAHLADADTGMEFSFLAHLLNSIVIGLLSTVATVALGTTCAYGF